MGSVIRAFSAFHICRLTGLSLHQLSYWDKTIFFKPYCAHGRTHGAYNRVYSFNDLVGLRVIAILRNEYQIPLQKLRKVAEELIKYRLRPWSGLVFYIQDKNVLFKEPAGGQIRRGGHPQFHLKLELKSVVADMQTKADALRYRTPDQIGQLERHRTVVHNAWVIAGTRIPTKTIWRYHEAGYSDAAILRDYPQLKPADIASAISHEQRSARKAS